MTAHDYRKRAAWLLAVSARLPSREVATTLTGYANEMLDKAEYLEQRRRRRTRPPQEVFPSPIPAKRTPRATH